MIQKQKKVFNLIINKYKRRSERGQGKALLVLRSHECNFNPIRSWYNPHFHCLVPDKETAEILQAEWLTIWGIELTDIGGQDLTKIEDVEHHLVEVIKYGSKIFTDPEMKKGILSKKHKVYAKALYTILKAFDGINLLNTCGFRLPKESVIKTPQKTIARSKSKLVYLPKVGDWVNLETGSMLTRYTPTSKHQLMMENIDRESS